MKYKYYFKKPRSEIAKDIIRWLAMTGLICIAANSPYFLPRLFREFKKLKKYPKKKVNDTFYRLRKKGCIIVEFRNKQIYIRLTEEGKKLAGWLQIDALKIKRPAKWDGIWRIVIFDIAHLRKFYREAFRGKLKELGFYPLQKSVWVYPFDCCDEIELLRDFFGLSYEEMRLIEAKKIGPDKELRKIFLI